MADWLITLPQHITWEAYKQELDYVAKHYFVAKLNFKVPFIPKQYAAGDRCFLVWRGKVRGWMMCHGPMIRDEPWACETTGTIWGKGNYITRFGEFYYLQDGELIKGFQGIRRYRLPRERLVLAAEARAVAADSPNGEWMEFLTPEEAEYIATTPYFRVVMSGSYTGHLEVGFDLKVGRKTRHVGDVLCGTYMRWNWHDEDPHMWSSSCDHCNTIAKDLKLAERFPDAMSGIRVWSLPRSI